MKKLLIITTLFTCLNAKAQKVYNDLKGFDNVELSNINGSADIQLGKDFSIKIDGLNKNA
ncbi:MAG: hypothetical protein NTZ59_06750 [Bacteroidetes bacterium]|jgi:hypothetical protein|nr:hypothetical protein [Bacteroidota bacterium]